MTFLLRLRLATVVILWLETPGLTCLRSAHMSVSQPNDSTFVTKLTINSDLEGLTLDREVRALYVQSYYPIYLHCVLIPKS